MIACAEWLGRGHTTCTRKPGGCVCEPKEPVCKEGHDPLAAMGKTMTKCAPTPSPYCGTKGGCTEVCGDIA